jgi:hypothetical protein
MLGIGEVNVAMLVLGFGHGSEKGKEMAESVMPEKACKEKGKARPQTKIRCSHDTV